MTILFTTICKIVLLKMLTVSQGHTIAIQILIERLYTPDRLFTYLWSENRGRDFDLDCRTTGIILDTRVAVGMDSRNTKVLNPQFAFIPHFVFKIEWSENGNDLPTLRILKWDRQFLMDGQRLFDETQYHIGGVDVGELLLVFDEGTVGVTLSYLDQDTSSLGYYTSYIDKRKRNYREAFDKINKSGYTIIHSPKDYKKGKNINFPLRQCKKQQQQQHQLLSGYPQQQRQHISGYPQQQQQHRQYFGGYPYRLPHSMTWSSGLHNLPSHG